MSRIICGIEDTSYDKRNKETKEIIGKAMYARVHFLVDCENDAAGIGQVPETFELPVEDFGKVFGKSYGMGYDPRMIKEFFANFINRPCIVESGVREFNGQISGRTLVKVHFIDELIAQLSAKPGNDLSKK